MVRVDDFAHLDIDRAERTGLPEIILAEGKSDLQLAAIVDAVVTHGDRCIVSRLDAPRVRLLEGSARVVRHHAAARLAVAEPSAMKPASHDAAVGVLAAGTADVPVAEEARALVAELGFRTATAYDVGVAGLHRLFPALDRMRAERVDVLIVAAGREGALPTVVAGLVDVPVVGLPVSTGYGFRGRGEAALAAMLQSCAPLSVVNIDAGIAAGAVAAQMARRLADLRSPRKVEEVRA